MSNEALHWAWNVELPTSRKFVLIVLADRANEDGYCWPSHRDIAEKVTMAPETVRGHLRALEEMGLLIRSLRYREDGSKTSNLYQLDLRWSATTPPVVSHQSPGGEPPVPSGGPPPVMNPHKEPTEKNPCEPQTEDDGHMPGSHAEAHPETASQGSPDDGTAKVAVSEAQRVWDAYVAMRQSSTAKMRRTELTPGYRKIIEKALKVATADEWIAVVPSFVKSRYHFGENDQAKKYVEPTHVFGPKGQRGAATVEDRFAWLSDLAGGVTPQTPQIVGSDLDVTGASPMIRGAVQAVRNSEGLAGGSVRQRGQDAERFLAEHGIRVSRDSGRLRFIIE